MEFDLASLAPTYRLIWRSAGASNALAIAQGLGFDPLVIEEARKVKVFKSDKVSKIKASMYSAANPHTLNAPACMSAPCGIS